MAEIEPVSGSGAAPGSGEAVPTAPVEGAQGDGAAGPRPARPKGLVRWGIALAVLAVTVGVVSVATALLAAGGSTSAVQGWLPSTTVAYLEVRADLPGDQRAKVGDLLAKFPGFADQASLDAKIDEALERVLEGSGVSWSADVKPWLGGEVGLAVTSAAFGQASLPDLGSLRDMQQPDDGAVALLAVKDAKAATDWIGKELGGTQATESYAGGDLTVVSGASIGDLAFAARGNVLVLGPVATVKAALDTRGSSPVGSSDAFAAARKTAPSAYLGFGYLDLKAFVDAALARAGGQAGLPTACLDEVVGAIPAWAAGSVRAADDAVVFESTIPAAAGEGAPRGSASGVADRLPTTTVAAVEIRDLGSGLVTWLDGLKKQLACDPSTADAIGQIDQALAVVGGAEGLIGWAGDAAFALAYDGGQLGGGLVALATDEAAAGRTLDQIRALLAIGGAESGLGFREEAFGDGTLLILQVPVEAFAGEVPEIAATAQRGVFVLGTIDFVKRVVETSAGSSLAASDAYKRAIAAAGGDGIRDVYVDIAGLRTAAEALMPADERARFETEVKPFLAPFEAFAAVTEAPGATTATRAVLTFTK